MSNQVEPIYEEGYEKPEPQQGNQPQRMHENLDLRGISDPASANNNNNNSDVKNLTNEVSQKLKRLDKPLVDMAILLQENREQIVVTPNGECYHYAFCETLRNTMAASRVSIAEAKSEGYVACKVCGTPQ